MCKFISKPAHASAVKLIPENGISKLIRFILIGLVLWSDTVEDSVKIPHLQELCGEINTVFASVCIFFITGI